MGYRSQRTRSSCAWLRERMAFYPCMSHFQNGMVKVGNEAKWYNALPSMYKALCWPPNGKRWVTRLNGMIIYFNKLCVYTRVYIYMYTLCMQMHMIYKNYFNLYIAEDKNVLKFKFLEKLLWFDLDIFLTDLYILRPGLQLVALFWRAGKHGWGRGITESHFEGHSPVLLLVIFSLLPSQHHVKSHC